MLQQRVDALAALALVNELEELLEHARRGARRGDELHDGEPFGRPLVTRRGRIGARRVERRDAVAG